jgi:hypothetical protein
VTWGHTDLAIYPDKKADKLTGRLSLRCSSRLPQACQGQHAGRGEGAGAPVQGRVPGHRSPLGPEAIFGQSEDTARPHAAGPPPLRWPTQRERAADTGRKLYKLTGWVGNPGLGDITIHWLDAAVRRLQDEGRP